MDGVKLIYNPGSKRLKERIELLATSYATDEDRLQVLIHLVSELAELVLNPDGKTDAPDSASMSKLVPGEFGRDDAGKVAR